LAFANIKKAAEHYGIELTETLAADVGVHPQSGANKRKRSAARALTEEDIARLTGCGKRLLL
jgi:hypothetical protein